MGKIDFSKIVGSVRTTIVKHSPEILTGIGIAGMITTTVLAVKATPKAFKELEEFKEAALRDHEKVKPVDAVKLTWKYYVPAAVTGTVSIACLVGASSVNARRNAALATAYTLSETAMKEYREKVIETIGEKKERVVRDEVAKEKVKSDPVSKKEVIITEKGNALCYDVLSGRYFKSDIDKLQKAANELNRRMRDEIYISLNEFYYEIGLDGIAIGDDIGWCIDRGYIDLDFSSQLADDNTPCLVVNYNYAPRYDYTKL
jgi:hypothetical protein